MIQQYNPVRIEKKWQKYWEEHETFKTDVWDFSNPKYYVLDMFPYPSRVGLHDFYMVTTKEQLRQLIKEMTFKV